MGPETHLVTSTVADIYTRLDPCIQCTDFLEWSLVDSTFPRIEYFFESIFEHFHQKKFDVCFENRKKMVFNFHIFSFVRKKYLKIVSIIFVIYFFSRGWKFWRLSSTRIYPAGQKAASAVFSKDWLFTIHRKASPLYLRRHRARARYGLSIPDVARRQLQVAMSLRRVPAVSVGSEEGAWTDNRAWTAFWDFEDSGECSRGRTTMQEVAGGTLECPGWI